MLLPIKLLSERYNSLVHRMLRSNSTLRILFNQCVILCNEDIKRVNTRLRYALVINHHPVSLLARKCEHFALIFLSFTKCRDSYGNVKRWKHEESVGAFRARRQEVKTREQFFILRGVVAVIARSFVRT